MPNNGYIDTPFASSGSRATVPDAVQPDGSVSYAQGYGIDYTLDPATNPSALDIEQTKFNQLMFDITSALQNWQQNTIAPFITSTMNGGTPYSYSKYNMVLSGGIGYISNSNTNTDTPPSAKWTTLSLSSSGGFYSGGVSTGAAANQVLSTVVPAGFALVDGVTVAFTAGFACPSGGVNFAISGTTNTAAKIWNGSAYVNPAANQFLLDETVFITYNFTQSCYVITDSPTLGTTSVTNLDGTNFQNSGGNLALGTAPVLPPATTATTQSGTDNSTKVATTAQVQLAIAAKRFASAQQTISTSGALTLAHGLPAAPFNIFTYIVCQTAEFGYSVGDKLLVSFGSMFSATGGGAAGAAITFDATNIYVQFASSNPLNNLLNKSNGNDAGTLTSANWKLVVNAMA